MLFARQELEREQRLQLPAIDQGMESRVTGITWEESWSRTYDQYGTDARFRGYRDDKGRLCVIICHNTDNGDGWEREGVDPYYFREFAEKKAYPLGINIIFYAMTH